MHAVIRALRRAVAVCHDVSDDLALPLSKLAPAQPAASPSPRQQQATSAVAHEVVAAAAAAATSDTSDPSADDDTSWFFVADPPAGGAPARELPPEPDASGAAAVGGPETATVLKERGNSLLKEGRLRDALGMYAAACVACERGASVDTATLAVCLSNSSLVRPKAARTRRL
jgi:hypothetical protein